MPRLPLRQWIATLREKRTVVRRTAGTAALPSDLLGRTPVDLDTPELQRFLAGKRVLVTGAGGSIGSEICRQAMKFCPQSLVLLDRAENALFEIDQSLREQWLGSDVRPVVADVCDAVRMANVLAEHRPHVVFHAAAHKHVPMMEAHPGEAVKNNILGTKVVADASLAVGVSAFVLISTDKAVNPTSVMGATKRAAELYVQSLNGEAGLGLRAWGLVEDAAAADAFSSQAPSPKPQAAATRFVAVRFGNVLGSSGSVVPTFARQIAAGGPVTVTDARMRRYFMTIPEASQLVMQAGAIGRGGEIFVLDMGEPVRILDLAEAMIRRQGLAVGRDIRIKITGTRPGEKLFEELANDSDRATKTDHPKIFVWDLPRCDAGRMNALVGQLAQTVDGPKLAVLQALAAAVPEYAPNLPEKAVCALAA